MSPVSQMAAWIGIYGLSLLTVLTGALFLTLLTDYARSRWYGPALSALIIAACFVGGTLRLAGGDVEHQPDIRLRLVQANIAQHHKWDPEQRARSFEQHRQLTAAPSERPVTHVIWPETASAYLLDEDAVARQDDR